MNNILSKLISWGFGLLTGLVMSVVAFPDHWDNSFLTAMLLILAGILMLVGYLAMRGRRLRLELRSSLNGELADLHQQMVASARRYKSLLDSAGEAIFIIDAPTGALQEVNLKALSLLGYERDELKQLTGKELVADTELRRFSSFFRRAIYRKEAIAEGIVFRRKNGTTFIGEMNAILLELGEEKLLQIMARDITFRHRAEREIRQRNRELSILNNMVVRAANQNLQLQKVLDISLLDLLALFEAQGGAIHLLASPEGKHSLAAQNGMASDILHHLQTVDAETSLLGKVISSRRHFTVGDLQEKRSPLSGNLVAAGFSSFAAIPLITRGEMIGILHLLTTSPHTFTYEKMKLFNTIGNQLAIIIEQARLYEELQQRTDDLLQSNTLLEQNSNQLASSQKQLRANLAVVEQANLEMERLNRMKSHFLGMVSHEFRSPLTSILGGSDFLLSVMPHDGSNEWRRVVELIHSGGNRLNEIVSDLLTLARLDSGQPIMASTPLVLEEVLHSARTTLEPIFAKRKQDVTFHPVGHIPHFQGEKGCLEDVFGELLANASKFTPDGGFITVTAQVASPARLSEKRQVMETFNPQFASSLEGKCFLEVEVRDTGVGVSRDNQLHIFSAFHELGELQHHSTGKDKFLGKGVGLGLAVVKGVVEAHGGMVWIETPPPLEDGSLPGCSAFVLLPLEGEVVTAQAPFPFMENGLGTHTAISAAKPPPRPENSLKPQ